MRTTQPQGPHRLARGAALAADSVTWRRRPAAFERHLARLAPAFDGLRARGHDNPNVLAILAVESYYRPRAIRAVEYALWALASALGRPVDRLSVGRAQLQLVHWRALGVLADTRFNRESLARVRDFEANYRACRRFLDRGGMLAEPRAKALAGFYAGTSQRYADLLATARSAIAAAPG